MFLINVLMENKGYTLVIGASEDASRYSNKAILSLRKHQMPVMAIGGHEGQVADVKILVGKPKLESPIDTVTMYISEEHQQEMIDYILSLKPRRIIFNPGAENELFASLAKKKGVFTEEACTLVLLSTGQY